MTERGASDLDVQSSTVITFDEVHQAALHRSADWLRDMGTSQATAYEVCCLVAVASVLSSFPAVGRIEYPKCDTQHVAPDTLNANRCF